MTLFSTERAAFFMGCDFISFVSVVSIMNGEGMDSALSRTIVGGHSKDFSVLVL